MGWIQIILLVIKYLPTVISIIDAVHKLIDSMGLDDKAKKEIKAIYSKKIKSAANISKYNLNTDALQEVLKDLNEKITIAKSLK